MSWAPASLRTLPKTSGPTLAYADVEPAYTESTLQGAEAKLDLLLSRQKEVFEVVSGYEGRLGTLEVATANHLSHALGQTEEGVSHWLKVLGVVAAVGLAIYLIVRASNTTNSEPQAPQLDAKNARLGENPLLGIAMKGVGGFVGGFTNAFGRRLGIKFA